MRSFHQGLSEAPGPERPVSAANKSGILARAARERSEQERETMRRTARRPHLPAASLGPGRKP